MQSHKPPPPPPPQQQQKLTIKMSKGQRHQAMPTT